MRIKQAEYISEYKIKILFSNGISKIVDFSKFLKDAKHVFIPLQNVDYFKKFIVDDVTLSWPNNADFDPELLYEMGVEIKKQKPTRKKTAKISSASISKGRVATSRRKITNQRKT